MEKYIITICEMKYDLTMKFRNKRNKNIVIYFCYYDAMKIEKIAIIS